MANLIRSIQLWRARRLAAYYHRERAYHLKLVRLHCEAAADYQLRAREAESDLAILRMAVTDALAKRIEA